MRTALLCLLACASGVAAPVPKAKKATDADLLEGRWVSVTIDQGSGHKPDTGYWIEVRDGKLSIGTTNAPAHTKDAPISLDPTQSPKHFDFTDAGGTNRWVYDIDGDTFTWCHPASGNVRPTGLKSDKPYCCTVWKRVKE